MAIRKANSAGPAFVQAKRRVGSEATEEIALENSRDPGRRKHPGEEFGPRKAGRFERCRDLVGRFCAESAEIQFGWTFRQAAKALSGRLEGAEGGLVQFLVSGVADDDMGAKPGDHIRQERLQIRHRDVMTTDGEEQPILNPDSIQRVSSVGRT